MTSRGPICIALAAALTTGCAHRPPLDEGDPRPELQQREEAFLEALSARDLERTLDHLADDAVLHLADQPAIVGREAIRQFYGNVFRFLSASEATPDPLHVSSSGDMAWSSGRVVNVFTRPEGAMEFPGKYALVWERRDGEWRVVLYAVSSDRPDPR